MPLNALNIRNVLKTICSCWAVAEEQLRKQVSEKHFDVDEEFISTFFFGELRHALKLASDKGDFEDAFAADLLNSFKKTSQDKNFFAPFWKGLVVEMSAHPRYVEAVTGGDFGLSIIRPVIVDYGKTLVKQGTHARGLICQSKVRRRNGDWGALTDNQEKKLKDRTNYLALCLYEYADDQRKCLKPFQWQLCKDVDITKVQDWLNKETFPSLGETEDLIINLGCGKIGTSDKNVIREIIHPIQYVSRTPSIELNVTWRKDARPPLSLNVNHHQSTTTTQPLQIDRRI